jgi:hypothetical protein
MAFMDEKQWLADMKRVEENAHEAHSIRAEAHKKIAHAYRILGGATDPDDHMSRQSALKVFEAHKLLTEGHNMLARSEELIASVSFNRAKIISSALEALVVAGGPDKTQDAIMGSGG